LFAVRIAPGLQLFDDPGGGAERAVGKREADGLGFVLLLVEIVALGRDMIA
jgi:hypothetical protein